VLVPNRKYYWKVRAFNDYSTCAPYTAARTFTTGLLSDSYEPTGADFACYPTLLTAGAALQLTCGEKTGTQAHQILVFDAMGRLMLQQNVPFVEGKAQLLLPAETWAAGMYQLVLLGTRQAYTQRIVLAPR